MTFPSYNFASRRYNVIHYKYNVIAQVCVSSQTMLIFSIMFTCKAYFKETVVVTLSLKMIWGFQNGQILGCHSGWCWEKDERFIFYSLKNNLNWQCHYPSVSIPPFSNENVIIFQLLHSNVILMMCKLWISYLMRGKSALSHTLSLRRSQI